MKNKAKINDFLVQAEHAIIQKENLIFVTGGEGDTSIKTRSGVQ